MRPLLVGVVLVVLGGVLDASAQTTPPATTPPPPATVAPSREVLAQRPITVALDVLEGKRLSDQSSATLSSTGVKLSVRRA